MNKKFCEKIATLIEANNINNEYLQDIFCQDHFLKAEFEKQKGYILEEINEISKELKLNFKRKEIINILQNRTFH